MTVAKKSLTAAIEIWDCGIAEHIHGSEEAASRCVEARGGADVEQVTPDNREQIFRLLDAGKRHGTIARELGVAYTTIRRAAYVHRKKGRDI